MLGLFVRLKLEKSSTGPSLSQKVVNTQSWLLGFAKIDFIGAKMRDELRVLRHHHALVFVLFYVSLSLEFMRCHVASFEVYERVFLPPGAEVLLQLLVHE